MLPDVADVAAFSSAVLEFVSAHSVRVIIPARDASVSALLPKREDLVEIGCVLALSSNTSLEVANDKDLTLEAARELGIACPESFPVNGVDELTVAADKLGFPLVLKPTVSWPGKQAERLGPVEVGTMKEAAAATEKFIAAGAGVLAQQLIQGRREGVTLFVADGEVTAAFAHVEHRTIPPLGGVSVLRESIELPPDTLAASERLARAIGLEGLCEAEYRRDAANRPLLMEINARPAGTIEIAALCGIDFPEMIWQHATGGRVSRSGSYRTGLRMRWLYGELRWLVLNRASAGRPDTVPMRLALWRFCSEFLRTRHYDSVDLRDLKPGIIELLNTAWFVRRHLTQPETRSKS
jgi:predicted ATP-grasp superfamily ATP-dependent carboligase